MDPEEVTLLEEWLDGLMGPQWARQRATTKGQLRNHIDWVMYISWLREVIAIWRISQVEPEASARRN